MANTYEQISIVIPAFNPDQKLLNVVRELSKEAFQEIIVVNDGSGEEYVPIFDAAAEWPSCTVLQHTENGGKGKALKTAFSYYSKNYPNGIGVITADADGQHTPSDIKKVAAELANQPSKLILGVRDFSTKDIPLRSRFGNVLTKAVVKAASGMKITDTQTGLRGISKEFAEQLLHVDGDRYEFEMKMILACKTYQRDIAEVTIDTIYIDDNESSHFHPIVDSIKIYYVFLRFLFSSLASFVVDVGLFALFSTAFKAVMPMGFILLATVIARILSSLFNYFLNRNIVFRSYKHTKQTLIKYYTLAALQMGASAGGVYVLYHSIGTHEVLIKIGVDSFLFLLSFYIQRSWVFKQNTAYAAKEVRDH
ncbi:glycosyltransferase [Salibacterium salarium]|uniref:Glycosyltransferase n=1 Tax=Salibacterium salarium TaxID=284579 RepID=A0A3R9P2V6_9BACI|nr:bifunctional glycosyltransferase family 2/GtrA family protein [Salibacterium salarium]RSL29891.1 glycosyltransferase [Salibacterium salarium]